MYNTELYQAKINNMINVHSGSQVFLAKYATLACTARLKHYYFVGFNFQLNYFKQIKNYYNTASVDNS